MKYLKQFLWIVFFSFLGEILHELIPLPVPASIYGLVLLFAALMMGIVKLEQVKGAADYLIDIMAVLFIPAGVGVMTSWDLLRPVLIPVVIIMLVSTIVVMGVAGRVTQAVIRHSGKKQEN
ncbi:MAG: CidA/LrgA family protein, partial [Clostridiales bacterium]|nr:CidA/LrgA family protein [Clostridiales bacterium]